jgi:hypothetical protein
MQFLKIGTTTHSYVDMVHNCPQKTTRPFGGAIHVFHVPHSGIDPTNGTFASKFEESPSNDNVSGVGGCNHIPPPSKSSSKLVFEI